MKLHTKTQIKWLFKTAVLIGIGMALFKYIPMHVYGKYILWDASSHVVWTAWGLYFVWFFVDQNKSWRVPYFVISAGVLTVMGIQRIIAGEHNEIGVMTGLLIAAIAIAIPRWSEFTERLKF